MFCGIDEDKMESDDDFEPTDAQLENYYWSGYERSELKGSVKASNKGEI